jgi:hypothetical protein
LAAAADCRRGTAQAATEPPPPAAQGLQGLAAAQGLQGLQAARAGGVVSCPVNTIPPAAIPPNTSSGIMVVDSNRFFSDFIGSSRTACPI